MAERTGATVTKTPGSHAVYVSNPAAVADLITQAARSVLRETRPADPRYPSSHGPTAVA